VPPDAKSSTLSSCPGAPQPRVILNQRGYVCTQSDSVRLRQGPARSPEVIVELPTGSQFTVTNCPSCADNWSWWQIQTDNGYTGWISEGGGDAVDPYFICPLP
jgi:SH3-like domain-containing protein